MEYNQAQTLEYTHTNEGRVRYNGVDYTYEYYLKDHLGNMRVMFHEDGTGSIIVDQVNNYYPFGMLFEKQNPLGVVFNYVVLC